MCFLFWGGFFIWLSAILLILAMQIELVGFTINDFEFLKYVFILGVTVCIFVDRNKFNIFYKKHYNLILFFLFVGWIPYINYIIKFFINGECSYLWDMEVILFILSSLCYFCWMTLEKYKKIICILFCVLILVLYVFAMVVDF